MAIAAEQEFEIPKPDQVAELVTDALDGVDAPEGDEAQGFRVDNEGAADWVARKLCLVHERQGQVDAQAHRQIEAVLASVQPWVDPIKEWQDGETARLSREAEHWEALLVTFHRHQLEADPKSPKTIRLPHATLSSRKLPDTWTFDDEFMDWARKERPELIRTVESVDKPLAKKELTDLSEVPGVTVTVGETRFSVETEEVAR